MAILPVPLQSGQAVPCRTCPEPPHMVHDSPATAGSCSFSVMAVGVLPIGHVVQRVLGLAGCLAQMALGLLPPPLVLEALVVAGAARRFLRLAAGAIDLPLELVAHGFSFGRVRHRYPGSGSRKRPARE